MLTRLRRIAREKSSEQTHPTFKFPDAKKKGVTKIKEPQQKLLLPASKTQNNDVPQLIKAYSDGF